MQVPAGTPVHEEAARYVELDQCSLHAGGIGEHHAHDPHDERRRDGIVAHLTHQTLDGIQLADGNALHLAGFVVDPQQQHAVAGVREGGKLVGEVVTCRASDLVACKAHRLELDE